MLRYRRTKREEQGEPIGNLIDRNPTELSGEKESLFGRDSRFISTTLNVKTKNRFDPEILPQLELLIARHNQSTMAPRLSIGQPPQQKHSSNPKRIFSNSPRNYADYLLTHKRRKGSNDESCSGKPLEQRLRGNTIIICHTVDTNEEESVLKISPTKRLARCPPPIDLPELSKLSSTPTKSFRATLTGVRKQLQEKIARTAQNETVTFLSQQRRPPAKFFREGSSPERKEKIAANPPAPPRFESCDPWRVEDELPQNYLD